jgi:hypothetical protein
VYELLSTRHTHAKRSLNMKSIAALATAAFLLSCTPTVPEEEQTMRVLRASGEHPSGNEMTVPEGAAFRAVNVVVDTPDAYSAHPGLETSLAAGRGLSSFTLYRGDVIAHSQEDGTLLRLHNGTWSEYAGAYFAPGEGVMSFQEAAGCLFFTTTQGLYRLDGVASTPTLSGLPQALPGVVGLHGAGAALAHGDAVAYRANWALNVDDGGNGRLIEGAPSPRLVIANSAGSTQDVDLTFPIPDNLPTGAYLRVFRADSVPLTISPLDEMRQVYERAPTPAEVSASEFTFTDGTPETVKGSSSYWAPNTGDGIAFSNYAAPLIEQTSEYADSVFGAGVGGVQRLTMDLVGIGAPTGLVAGQGLILSRGVDEETYAAQSSEAFPTNFKVFTGGTPAQNIADTVASLVRAINSRSGGFARAFVIDTDGTRPGEILIEARDLDRTPIVVNALYGGSAWLPRPEGTFVGDAARSGSTVTITTAVAHGVVVGDQINLLTNSAAFPSGVKTVVGTPTSTTFTYTEAGATTSEINKSIRIVGTALESSTGTADNAYAWSKRYEPDHWPLTNLNTVGGATDVLWWTQPLDRWNYLGSDAGLFRLSGNADDGFTNPEQGAPWDSSLRFLGRRNHAVLDGQGYALSYNGIVSWSEGSKPVNVDGPIQREIREALAAYPEAMSRYGFMYADSVHHRLYFARPESAEATSATLIHVWNGLTGAWTRLTSDFPGLEEGTLAGMAPPAGVGVMYLLPTDGGTPTNREGTVLTTRNTGSAADFQGPEAQGLECKVTYMPWQAGEPQRFKMWSRTAVYTQKNTSRVTFGYSTDLLPTEQTQTYPDIDPLMTQPVAVSDPLNGLAWKSIIGNEPGNSYMRGRSMSVSVAHSEPGEEFRLFGVEVQHRAYGSGQ